MINIVVIGYGYWGPNLVRNIYENSKTKLTYIIDNNPKTHDKIILQYPGVKIVSNIEEIITNPDIDAVVIATPVSTHFDIAYLALSNGKHVFVEKPISNSISSAEKLVKIANQNQLILMVGHVFLYDPIINKIKNIISSGKIGNPRIINSQRRSLGPRVRSDSNILFDYAIHDAYILPFILSDNPIEVSAVGSKFIQSDIEDWVQYSIRFKNNCYGNGFVSWYDPQKHRNMTIVGEKNMLFYDDLVDKKLIFYKRGFKNFDGIDLFGNINLKLYDEGYENLSYNNNETLKLEIDHFIDCIISGDRPLSSGEDGVTVMKILNKMQESMDKGGMYLSI